MAKLENLKSRLLRIEIKIKSRNTSIQTKRSLIIRAEEIRAQIADLEVLENFPKEGGKRQGGSGKISEGGASLAC